MSNAWSIFVIVLVVGNLLAMLWLLIATSKKDDNEAATTGHQWDGIEELNNPLPSWWLWLFVISIVFGAVYLYLYPGLGSYAGSLGWTQQSQYEQELQANFEAREANLAQFEGLDAEALGNSEQAMGTARRLFLNNCATCHGSDGRGAKGFPNLTDSDWLYGSDMQTIMHTIQNGRAGLMPDLNLDEARVSILARYVLALAGDESITDFVREKGESQFAICASCHGADAKGNQALGAPDLTDGVWLHGGQVNEIERVLRDGKQGNMPGFNTLLSEAEIHLLAAYVKSLGKH